jgi:hypothetical protein
VATGPTSIVGNTRGGGLTDSPDSGRRIGGRGGGASTGGIGGAGGGRRGGATSTRGITTVPSGVASGMGSVGLGDSGIGVGTTITSGDGEAGTAVGVPRDPNGKPIPQPANASAATTSMASQTLLPRRACKALRAIDGWGCEHG